MKSFLNGFYDYPITHSEQYALRALKDDFTKAVMLHIPELLFASNKLIDNPNYQGADKYWCQEGSNERRKPGQTTYVVKEQLSEATTKNNATVLTPEHIERESSEAGIFISKSDIHDLYDKMTLAIRTFSRITAQHTQNDNFYMRAWQMWAPMGGNGRSPTLHIDNTVITGLWYAGRTPADIYISDIPDRFWKALDATGKKAKGKHTQKKRKIYSEKLTRQLTEEADKSDLMKMPVGPLIITRNADKFNQEGQKVKRDYKNPIVQQTSCLHKSGDMREKGQAGIVMVPQFY